MKMHAPLFAILFSFLISSCSSDFIVEELQYPDADPRLWEYFERFENEALQRGLRIDLNQIEIIGKIEPIEDQGVAGVCQYGSAIHNNIAIDRDFWNRVGANQREMVVFHELGHCVLLRAHREDQNQSGLCLSIMRSGTGTCRDAYNVVNRPAYLDELFSITNDLN
ncbi:hypothetical protein [Portibacter marinus]|uniref:hypothetical protein n=1 Tax=Portibacter marinus TaxID=2898660 RepID=UPI001F47B251|nr:hypothetical protein [Portibacter marinus]